MPGLRTALTIIADADLRARYLKGMRNNNELIGVNTLGTLALQTAYGEGEAWLEALLPYLEGNLNYLQNWVNLQMPQLRLVKPEVLFLVWIDRSALGRDAKALARFFHQEANVYPVLGGEFGAGGDGFGRFNFACPRNVLAAALDPISSAFGRAA